MSKTIDLTGQKFNHLTVLYKDIEKSKLTKKSYWVCQCDCGNYKSVYANNLKTGHTQSCGCYQKKQASEKNLKDLTGQRFGYLTVIERYGNDQPTKWKCQCDCGKETIVLGQSLLKQLTLSCGCYQKVQTSKSNKKDLTNQIFGKLLVKKENGKLNKSGNILWECECQCGNQIIVIGSLLLNGAIKDCGCEQNKKYSRGENIIESILKENNISYIKQKTYKELGRLRYDFYLPDYNRLIEFDGKQHFEPIDFFGGENSYKKQKERDELKNIYAVKHNIDLIRIPYYELNFLTLDLLLGNKYLI